MTTPQQKEIENAKYRTYNYKHGSDCDKCGKRLTRFNKRGRCRPCWMMGNNKPALARWKGHVKKAKGQGKASGEHHSRWKGDNVGYSALHRYVRKIKPEPDLCECCNERPPKDLANKGTYDRNPDNWEYLCRKCHTNKDGRLSQLIANPYKHPPFNGSRKLTC